MQTITVEELKEKISTNPNIHLLDVRAEVEHQEFNIGGLNYPLPKIQTLIIDEIEHLKNEEVICYCRSGIRSNMACLMLEHLGFTNTYNVEGGVMAWQAKLS